MPSPSSEWLLPSLDMAIMVMDMAMVMGTMDNLENQIFVLCTKLSMDELSTIGFKSQ